MATRLPEEPGSRPLVAWSDDAAAWLGAGETAEAFGTLLESLDLLRRHQQARRTSAMLLTPWGDHLAASEGRKPSTPAVRAFRRGGAGDRQLEEGEVFDSVTGNIQASLGVYWSRVQAREAAEALGDFGEVDIESAVAFRRYMLAGLTRREGRSINDLRIREAQAWGRLDSMGRFVADQFHSTGDLYADQPIDAKLRQRAKKGGIPFRLLKVCPDGCGVIFAGRADKARCDICKASNGGRAANPPDDHSVVDWSARRVKGRWEYREVRSCRCGDDFVSHRASGAGAQKLLCGPCSRNRASFSRANRGST